MISINWSASWLMFGRPFSGEEFTQDWDKKGEPLSAGAQFVHAVVRVVDKKRLASVPNVTEEVVHKQRNDSTSGK